MGENVFNRSSTSFWFDKWIDEFTLWEIRINEVGISLLRALVAD